MHAMVVVAVVWTQADELCYHCLFRICKELLHHAACIVTDLQCDIINTELHTPGSEQLRKPDKPETHFIIQRALEHHVKFVLHHLHTAALT